MLVAWIGQLFLSGNRGSFCGALIGLVRSPGPSRSISSGGAWSASQLWSAVLSCGRRVRSAQAAVFRCTIAAPRQRALYPTLPYPTLTLVFPWP